MPFRIRFLHRDRIAVTVVRGNLTYDDLLEHRAAVAREPGYHTSFRLLFDARRVQDFTLTGDQIRAFADFAQPGQPRFARVAVLVAGDAAYGLSRIFQAYSMRHDERSLLVSRDSRAAWAWLTAD